MKYVVIATVFLLAGCAGGGEIPELNQYLLRSDSAPGSTPPGVEATVGLGNLEVADYLDQLGLVLETPGGTVRSARYHQWAEPLRESLRAYLAEDIAHSAGQPIRHRSYDSNAWKREIPRVIDIQIDQLHGTGDGNAKLVATWAIINNDNAQAIAEHRFVDSEPLAGDGYGALVRAEKRLLSRLARSIAAAL